MSIKSSIKDLLPPIIIRLAQKTPKYGFFGSYNSWAEAIKASKGYDDPAIIEKVRSSLMKVKRGEVAYERDSVVFDEIQYSWPVLAGLLWAANANDGRLNVIDFGGSLGSSYFQNLPFLKDLSELSWTIVEQKNFVDIGKKEFEDNQLKFAYAIDDAKKSEVILLSSVIQYLEKPYEMLEKIVGHGFRYVIFDRTAFLSDHDRLTVQKVPPRIYDASYPAWFLSENKFKQMFSGTYDLVAEFDSLAGNMRVNNPAEQAHEKGFIFKRKP
ncbi:MAG: methyltransferase, TIGR04325 family [Patescibacteria group bacterium]|nr:methyltransferase, TIGR04325 family [Patescibacteria group bacterium]MDE2172643.1 methyltransferase, TIGR04325 family [Patescibacteria group bacterium]